MTNNMDYEIIPYVALGDIKFGLLRKEIEQIAGSPTKTFKRNEFAASPTDMYESLGIMIDYDETGRCEAVETWDAVDVKLMGKSLLSSTYSEILSWFLATDKNIEEDDVGFTSYKYGIGLYAPYKEEEPNKPCKGVLAFKRGYFDE